MTDASVVRERTESAIRIQVLLVGYTNEKFLPSQKTISDPSHNRYNVPLKNTLIRVLFTFFLIHRARPYAFC